MIPRIGNGYDVHRRTEGDEIRLGGVRIPAPFSLQAHSDGDVLIHAMIDALLGALGRGDIGSLFPDDDPGFQNASGLELLERTLPVLDQEGYGVGNLDATVIAQEPKLESYIPRMRERIGKAVDRSPDRVSVKATTHEGLGPLGNAEGIAVYAVALLLPFEEGTGNDR